MTKFKRVVAVMLAFLMIFSSASVLASAWDASVDDGSTLEISTKFFKEVDGELVETQKVRPGDTVKARVYLGTDYYSNGSTLLFFYDKDFFSHNYSTSAPTVLEVNSEAGSFAAANGVYGSFAADYNMSSKADANGVDSAFLDEYAAFYASVYVGNGSKNVMFDNSTWLFEFTLTVNGDADGEGDLLVKESTIQSTTKSDALIDVPKGPADGSAADVWPMWLWDATPVLSSQPVTTGSSVTFNANTGVFADDTTTYVIDGLIDEAIDASEIRIPSKTDYSFMGWIDAADETPTYEEIVAAPTAIPENDLVLNAYWMENVDIKFETGEGTSVEAHTDVKPYSEFAEVGTTSRTGYTFKGWALTEDADFDDVIELPATYPDTDTTYFAVWAKNVTITLKDGETVINEIDGVEGDSFQPATIPDPTKLGHVFIMWSPELPTVFPGADATYNAIFETLTYTLTYFAIDGETGAVEATAEVQLEYGATIPTNIPTIILPDGKEYADDVWYTDEDCTTPLAAGATMGADRGMKLYRRTKLVSYDAIFMVDDAEYARVDTVFEDVIEAPADPAKAGYIFAGWSPEPTILGEPNDMYFYATWVPAVNQAVYVVDGAQYEVYEVENGDALDVPADPYKEGYTFLGWAEEADSDVVVTLPATMPGEYVDFYAVFEINEYTITFDSKDGTAVDSITKEYDEAIGTVADPTKTGYTFIGWSETDGDNLTADNKVTLPANMPAENKTYYAIWKINEYTITFVDTGDVAYEAITKEYNAEIGEIADPVKTGYTFKGWSEAIPATMPAGDMTITASWEANIYDAVFMVDGTEYDRVPTAYDSAIVAPANPTKDGYTFSTWDPAVGNMDDINGKTFNAVWTANGDTAYKVYTYIMGVDGQYVKTEENLTGETATTATATVPTIENGFTLNTDKSVLSGEIAADGSLKLYVYIDRNEYTLTINSDNGTEAATAEYLYGATILAVADPVKEGYTFQNWSPSIPATMPDEDLTVTAVWQINSHDVVWTIDGKDTTQNYDFGETIVAPEASKTGYEFKGWTPEFTEGTTMPDEALAFTAVFEANVYDAVFMVDGTEYARVPTAYDSDIVAPAAPEKAGYVFGGWDKTVGIMDDVNGKTFNAIWTNATDTKYVIEVYEMDTTGAYPVTPTTSTSKTGETSSEVTAEYTVGEGFVLDADAANVLSGTIAADGSLVLKVYLERNQYTFTVDSANGTEAVETMYYYGATVTAPQNPEREGYEFIEWSPEAPSTMPANDVTIVAQWEAKTDIAFMVVVNYTDLATGEQTAEFPYYDGTADQAIAIVEAIPENADENTYYILLSDLAVSHYELDAEKANQLTGTVAPDGSTVLNLYYKAIEYTATFKANDGTYTAAFEDGDVSKDVVLAYNSLIKANAPAAPVRAGYTFAGWQGVNDATRLNGNRTFNATWTADSFTFTWVIDENDTKEFTYATDELIVKQPDPIKTGYTFTGWDITIPDTMPANDVTATAQWKINQYTITFDTDGGTQVAAITQDYNSDIVADTTTTKAGYTFAGWVDENSAAATVPAKMPAENITLKATWTINQYTITFNTDGGTDVASITQDYNTEISIAPTTTKTGYTFKGWAETKGATAADKVDLPATMPAENKTYYAIWEINQYGITFEKNNGTEAETVTADYNSDVNAIADPSKDGYTFKGWSETNGGTTAVTFPVKMPLEGTTYYAIWEANKYTITFDALNNTAAETVAADYLANVAKPATDPTKEGYTFKGWSETNGGTTAVTFPVQMPLNGMTLYAIWEVETYTVKWDVDGTVTSESYEYGAALNIPAPTKTGYTFDGWNGLAEGTTTMPDVGDNGATVTYIAKWTANTYDAIFMVDGAEYDRVPTVFNEAIVAPANPTKAGYIFNGWNPTVDKMTAEGMTFEATWIADTATRYTINTYTMGTDGTYGDPVSTQGTGATDTTADATPATVAEGFALDTDHEYYKATGTITADNGLVLNIYIKRNEYTFKTVVDGTETPVTYLYGATVVAPVVPTKTGYTFGGWDNTVPATMPANDVTLTATWNINKWNVVYKVDGNVYQTVENVVYDTDVTVIDAPVKEGYTFSGWSQTETFKMPDNEVVIEGTFTAIEYTITFDTDGGSEIEAITQAYESEVKAPDAPTKPGYTFAGWIDGNGAKVEVPATMPLGGAALKATWTANPYTVTYLLDKDGALVYTTTAAYGQQYNVPTATKEGYTFDKWVVNETGADAGLTAGGLTTIPLDGATYYATWTVNNYKLVYRTYNGVYAEYDVAYGTAAADMPAPATAPTRDGYTYGGWNAALPETMPAQQVNLVAKWTIEKYNVTWNYNDGVTADKIVPNVEYNSFLEIPAPERKGYTFNYWEDANGDEFTATEMPDVGDDGASVTYTANWTANVYEAIFNANDGAFTDGDKSKTVEAAFDSEIVAPAAPERAGYTFNGWNPAVDKMTEEGMTFEATWLANDATKYTINTYTMGIDGTYGDPVATLGAGATDTIADATPETIADGFALDTANSTLTGKITADEKLVLSVYISRNQYTFTVDNNDGTAATETKYYYEAPVTAPAQPTKVGYTFAGWDNTVPSAMPANDVAVKANWTINTWDVVYKVDGTETSRIPTVYGTDVTVADAPVKEGYTFSGWSQTGTFSMPDNEVVIEGTFTINKHNVIYTVDGATYQTVENVEYGTEVTVIEEPTKTGYTFSGWSQTGTFEMPDEDVTISGTFTAINYTVTWVDGDTTVAESTLIYEAVITAPEQPVKEGYTFAGWKDADGAMFSEGATMPAKNVTYTAQWTAKDDTAYRVKTYMMNLDGTTYAETAETLYGTTDEIATADTSAVEGFTYNADKSTATGVIAGDGSLVLEVYYDRNKIAVNVTNIEENLDGEYYYGSVIETEPTPIIPEGNSFNGWIDEDGVAVAFPYTVPDEADKQITISPVFKANDYTVTWVYANGAEDTTSTVTYGTVITAPAEPTKIGYTFAGWMNADSEKLEATTTMPANNVTYTAQWTAKSGIAYTVKTYMMGLDRQYTETVETLYGTTGATATADTTAPVGFTYNATKSTATGSIAGDGSLILTVYFDRNEITVNVNGAERVYLYDEVIESAEEPTAPEGHEFTGWEDEDGEAVTFPYNVPDEEDKRIDITPVFTPVDYTATFVYADGSSTESQVTYGTAIVAPDAPDRDGYVFIMWADANGKSVADYGTMPAQNLTFNAVYEASTYQVNYWVNGKIVADKSAEYGETIITGVNAETQKVNLLTYTTPEGYIFDGWYTDAEMLNKLADGATVGAAVVNLYAAETAGTYDAIFMVDGAEYARVPTVYDEEIVLPEAPAKEGYTFTGWDPNATIMDYEGMTFNATWVITEDAYTITYIVDGETYEVYTQAYGDELDVPADPYKDGYAFIGWTDVENGTEAITLPATVGTSNLTFYAILEINSFTVNFNNNIALDDSPYKSDELEVYETATYNYGETVVMPADPTNINAAYWTFKGWTDVEGSDEVKYTAESVITVADSNIELYAVYARVDVKLLPAEGSTTVIERNFDNGSRNGLIVKESYAEGTVTAERNDEYPLNADESFIYGLKRNCSKTQFTAAIELQGDGTLEITYSNSRFAGTGTHVIVRDNVTGEVVEEFYVVIFGDVNGDGNYNTADTGMINAEASSKDWSLTSSKIGYMFKAANVNGDRSISTADTAIVNDVAAGQATLNQVTGKKA